jgi:hypothetical protein
MKAIDPQWTVSKIDEILSRKEVRDATLRLLSGEQRDRLSQAVLRMQRKIAFVAVIGSQGNGKSSLLNALLFSTRILPIGEGVTTSLVCFVHDAKDTEPRCEVAVPGRVITKPLDLTSLREFMDEGQNPQNQKGVRSISCFAKAELLKDNTSFVDTPGLGSLLTWQDAETGKFVRDMSLGLFVLRTVPTLTESEAGFLNDMWKFCPEYIFVQNVWGESPSVVAESLRDNADKLAGIACNHGDSRPITLLPVNIHIGLEGATNSKPQDRVRSGLSKLEDEIKDRVGRGGQWFEVQVQSRQIVSCLQLAIGAGHLEISAAALQSEKQIRKLTADLDDVEASIREAQQRQAKNEEEFQQRCNDTIETYIRQARNELELTCENYQTTVRRDGGYEGIGEEFLAKLKNRMGHLVEEFQLAFGEVARRFAAASQAEIDRIEDTVRTKVKAASEIEDVSGTHVAEFFGKVASSTGTVAVTALTGMSASVLAGTIAAGGTALAGVAAGIAAVPVVGWAIAGAVLVGGWVLTGVAKEKRKNALLREFSRIKETTEEELTRSLRTEAVSSRDTIATSVREQVRAAANQQVKLANDMKTTLAASEGQKRAVVTDITQMVKDLDSAVTDIRHLGHLEGSENFPSGSSIQTHFGDSNPRR